MTINGESEAKLLSVDLLYTLLESQKKRMAGSSQRTLDMISKALRSVLSRSPESVKTEVHTTQRFIYLFAHRNNGYLLAACCHL